MFRLLCIAIGYGIGCLQSAYVVGKVMHKDIRKYGSGNLGSTNALRVLGKKAGAITFVCDLMKAVIAFILVRILFPNDSIGGLYACAGVVLGHDFPFYLGFQGGKGIASMIGMALSLSVATPVVAAISFSLGILGLFTRYVSVGSMVFAIAVPIACFLAGYSWEAIGITGLLGALALFQHRANISRLLRGEENRLGAKKETV